MLRPAGPMGHKLNEHFKAQFAVPRINSKKFAVMRHPIRLGPLKEMKIHFNPLYLNRAVSHARFESSLVAFFSIFLLKLLLYCLHFVFLGFFMQSLLESNELERNAGHKQKMHPGLLVFVRWADIIIIILDACTDLRFIPPESGAILHPRQTIHH